ncbi:MAG TPA: hypothetical protein PLE70_05915 [Methanolinea sp.]|nr:hypothetical protein [Methanolinea sp.]
MSLRNLQNTWTGFIAGTFVTVASLALHFGGAFPPSVTGYLLLFAGGFTAGLFTRETVMKGALAGLAMGCIVVAGMVGWTMSAANDRAGVLPLIPIAGAFAMMSAVFVPANTVCGIIGAVIRKWSLKEPYFSTETSQNPSRNELLRWVALIAGAFIIAGSPFLALIGSPLAFLMGSLTLQIIASLSAGFLVGFFSSGSIRDAAISGLIAAVVGVGILAVPMFWLSSQGTGFVSGLAGIVLIIVAVTAIPTVVIGSIIGALVKKRILPQGSQ